MADSVQDFHFIQSYCVIMTPKGSAPLLKIPQIFVQSYYTTESDSKGLCSLTLNSTGFCADYYTIEPVKLLIFISKSNLGYNLSLFFIHNVIVSLYVLNSIFFYLESFILEVITYSLRYINF